MIGFLQQYGFYVGGAFAFLIIALKLIEDNSWLWSKPRVREKPFLTKAEREALRHIETALPWCRIHAQVSMGALVQPAKNLSRSDHYRERGKFSQKIVDFVVEDRASGKVVVLIELDDRTHQADRDGKRDQITAIAGYKTIRLRLRWPTKRNIAIAIERAISELRLSGALEGANL